MSVSDDAKCVGGGGYGGEGQRSIGGVKGLQLPMVKSRTGLSGMVIFELRPKGGTGIKNAII